MGWMGCTASADVASNPHVCEHEQRGNAAAGCSIHPAAWSNYQQPFQVPDGVQGEKHRAPSCLVQMPSLLPSQPHALEQPRSEVLDPRVLQSVCWWRRNQCPVRSSATCLLHPAHCVGGEGAACCGPGWPRVLAARSTSA